MLINATKYLDTDNTVTGTSTGASYGYELRLVAKNESADVSDIHFLEAVLLIRFQEALDTSNISIRDKLPWTHLLDIIHIRMYRLANGKPV